MRQMSSPGLARRHFLVVVVDDLELHDARHRLPEGARRSLADGLVGEAALHRAVPLEDLHVEALLESLPDGLRRAGADHHPDRVLAVVRLLRLVVDAGHHPPEGREGGAAVLAADVPDAALGEARAEDRLDPQGQRREERHRLGVAVGEGQAVVEDIVLLVLPHDHVEDVEQSRPVVADGHALGVPGGPGGVDDLHGLAHVHDHAGPPSPMYLFPAFHSAHGTSMTPGISGRADTPR